jgi:Tfp pilus assembly protein PilN
VQREQSVKPLRIDFAPPSLARTWFHTSRPARALAAVALVLAVCAGLQAQRLSEQRRIDAEQVARVTQHHAAPVQAAQPQAKVVVSPAQAAAVNAAVLQLNLPWRDLYDAIGAATPATVALLALEPDARKRTVRITAEARGSDDMIGYIERLQAQSWFTSVVLTHHETNDVDPNKPVRFQIDAQWAGQP